MLSDSLIIIYASVLNNYIDSFLILRYYSVHGIDTKTTGKYQQNSYKRWNVIFRCAGYREIYLDGHNSMAPISLWFGFFHNYVFLGYHHR